VLCLPLIISTIQVMQYVPRLSGVDLEKSLAFGQSFASFISFLLPFATLKNMALYGGHVDQSFINHFFGAILLMFFMFSFIKKQPWFMYLILAFGLLIFLMSFKAVPVRYLFYQYVPFMDLFLASAYVRVFGIFPLILLGGNGLAVFLNQPDKYKSKVIFLSVFVFAIYMVLLVFGFFNAGFDTFIESFGQGGFERVLASLSFHQHIVIQGLIQVCVIGSFLLLLFKWQSFRWNKLALIILVFIELFFAAQLNMSKSVVSMDSRPFKMQSDLSLTPSGFPVPINNKIKFNNRQHAFFAPFWRNTHIFSKLASFQSFSSFELQSFSQLDDYSPNLKESVLNNHLFYFSDSVKSMSFFKDSLVNPALDSKILYVSDMDYKALENINAVTDSADKMTIKAFSPKYVEVRTKTQNTQYFTFLQTNYPGWVAYIDEEPVPIYTSNFNYRTIILPKGEHTVTYKYDNKLILILYVLSMLLFILLVLYLTGLYFYKAGGFKWFAVVASVVMVFLLVSIIIKSNAKPTNQTLDAYYAQKWQHYDTVLTVIPQLDKKLSYCDVSEGYSKRCFQADSSNEYIELAYLVNNDSIDIKNTTMVLYGKVKPKNYNEVLIASEIVKNNQKSDWHVFKLNKQIERIDEWNRFLYFRNMYDLNNNEGVHLYIWNIKKSEFKLDSLKVEFYRK